MSNEPLLLYTHPKTGELWRRHWKLIVVEGHDRGTEARLNETPALIGAAPAATLVLTDDTVSRYHAEIDLFAEGLRVRDLDSTNGTFLDGEARIREGFVENGGTFRVGSTSVRLIALDEPASSEIPTDPALVDPDGVVEIGDLIAAAPVIHTLIDDVRRIAGATSAVLIVGERGAGKATLARVLHQMSTRRARPFIAADAAELDAGAFRRTFFGEGVRLGLFTRAHRGILFIENVEHLPQEAQRDLRVAIDRQEVRPLGGDDKILRVDVRIVCASTVDLRTHAGFDPKLARRLAVVRLEVPPLRQRPEDAHAIAARRLTDPFVLGSKVQALLDRQTWPNNVDDLEALFAEPAGEMEGALLADALHARFGDVSGVAEAMAITSRELFARLAAHDVDLDAM